MLTVHNMAIYRETFLSDSDSNRPLNTKRFYEFTDYYGKVQKNTHGHNFVHEFLGKKSVLQVQKIT